MMQAKVCLTFDDGLIDQYKWARLLFNNNIKGTFYINPFSVGNPGCLELKHLTEMHDEWNHMIANHLWIHEAPIISGVGLELSNKINRGNFEAARDWLVNNGFQDGSNLLALPYGSSGGQWTPQHIEELRTMALHVRDYGLKVVNESYKDVIWNASESHSLEIRDNCLSCYCFHSTKTTEDDILINLIEQMIDAEVEFTSILEICNVN